ncbi:hypothetical protein [Flavobacterium hydatis]|uniref:Sequence-variable mosaic (SVM) signal sequence domain-containing protein n=1 Tax=Flavobacterium hydatis TaxID=991 RepID=A0ABX4CFJ0_FLAHY|nr:hypothetical protein [Flavobacterium hydatis]OXA92437.1 hypothetical protein B0A62_15525 [Flavobacterium hydatis]
MMQNTKKEFFKIKNKTRFVLFFYFIFFLFLGQNILANTNNITQLKDNCKKEISIKKKLSAINNDIDSAFSSEDSDIENHYFIPNKIQVYLQINSFDNRFSLLKKSQNSRHFHLPLFIQYHAIKIP